MGDEHRLGMTGSRVHQGGPPAEESRPSLNQEYEGNLKSISFLAEELFVDIESSILFRDRDCVLYMYDTNLLVLCTIP